MKHILETVFFLLFASLMGFNSYAVAHTDVTPQEAKNMIDTNNQLIVVDVREASEYCGVSGHIPGAVNYPWNSGVLQARYQELPLDAEILVVCLSGHRSHPAAGFLDSKGYLYVYDMLGGMSVWGWETVGCVDTDGDGINDDLDPDDDNDGICDPGESDPSCTGSDNCQLDYNPNQEDTYPPQSNGIGDACDCEANFDCDQDVDANDVTAFLTDFGRSIYNRPCTNQDPCKGDFSYDGDVDANDVTKFLEDFGRSQYNNPCPACTQGQPWCVYQVNSLK